MRLTTFDYRGTESWGFVVNHPVDDKLWIYEPAKVDKQLQLSATTTNGYSVSMPKFMPDSIWPETLVDFLKLEDEGMEVLRKLETFLLRFLEQSDDARMAFCGHPLEEVSLKSPIPQPRLLWGLVQNSPTFIRSNAQRQSTNLFPMGHQRPVGSVIGDGQMLYQPADTGNLTYNVELAIVIGKEGRYIPVHKAMEYVAGYTIVTDYTMDCYHKLMDQDGLGHYNVAEKYDWYVGATMSWGGKMSDTHCGVGPWITTREEIGNVYDLLVYTKMNGRMRDRAHTAGTLLGVERVIQWYSSFATLYPGDILHLGTLGTDGLKLTNDLCFSGPDCMAECEIEKIGTLRNSVLNLSFGDWRADDDVTKTVHVSPAARDVIARGEDEIASPADFDLAKTRHYWTIWKNYNGVTEKEGIHTLKTPRFLCAPASAVGTTGVEVEIPPRANDLEVSVELAAVMKKIATKVDEKNIDEYVLGYSPMITITDSSFGDILVGPTTNQERGLPLVYGRWADNFNVMLEKPVAAKWNEVLGKKMHLSVDGMGQADANTDEYHSNIGETVSFVTKFVTMFPGDVVTLGHTENRILIPKDKVKDGMKITASLEGVGDVELTLKKSTAQDTFVPFNQLKL